LAKPVSVAGQFGSKLLIARPPSVQYSLGKRTASTSLSPRSAALWTTFDTRSKTCGWISWAMKASRRW
jgi:hypothetical protein